MKKKLLFLSLLAGALAAGPVLAQQDAGDERERDVEERRVVITVSEGEEGEGEQFVWVQRDGEEPVLRAIPMGKPRGHLGVNLTEMTPELREALGAPRELGVLVNRVVPESPAALAGLEAGDVLTRIEGADLRSTAEVQAAIFPREKGDVVTLEVYRDRTLRQLSATLDVVERPRLNIAEFLALAAPDGKIPELRSVAPKVPGLPLEKLEKLEKLELKRIPFDEKRLQAIYEALARNPAGPSRLSPEEQAEYEETVKKLQERLEQLEEKLRELEERQK